MPNKPRHTTVHKLSNFLSYSLHSRTVCALIVRQDNSDKPKQYPMINNKEEIEELSQQLESYRLLGDKLTPQQEKEMAEIQAKIIKLESNK